MKRNKKQEGTNLFDCIPQVGPCPLQCNQCYYNRTGAFYVPINESHFPTLEEIGDGIVRVNSGADSNISRGYVIESTEQYPKRFFNTSIPRFDFPDPIVFTVNRDEESAAFLPAHLLEQKEHFYKLMFVRLRVSSTNLHHVFEAIKAWSEIDVFVVLTFMRYYDKSVFEKQVSQFYEWRKATLNTYWCPTSFFMQFVLDQARRINPSVQMCGSVNSSLCKNCLNCETEYYVTKERMIDFSQF